MLILILTFASLIIDSTSSCVPTLKYNGDENITGLISSSAAISSDKKSLVPSDSSYVITVENAKDYSIVAGISYLGEYYDPQRLCFALNIDRGESQFSITFIQSNSANWTTLVVHYLASKISDFIIGNALVQSELIPKDQSINSINIRQSYSSTKTYGNRDVDSFTFLTGINTSNRFLQVYIQKATFSPDKKIVFNVNFKNKTNTEIQYLQFGYIIYQVQQNLIKVSSIGDALFQQFKASSYVVGDKNQFIGMTSIDVRKLTNFNRRLLATRSIALGKPAYIQSFFKAFRIRGVSLEGLVGSAPRLTDEGLGLKVGDTCQNYKDCEKNGGILAEYQGILSCIKCRENSSYNPQQQLCKCNDGYYRNGMDCSLQQSLPRRLEDIINCTQKQINLPQCRCPLPQQFLNFRNQKCECKPGYKQYNLVSGIRCISCPTNQQFDLKLQKCYCPTNIYENNVCCICSDPLAVVDPVTKNCECIAGTDKFRERCVYCPTNSTYRPDLKICQCNEGFEKTSMNLCQMKSALEAGPLVLSFRTGFINDNNNIRRV